MKCNNCNTQMKPLMVSWFCPNNCDKTPYIAEEGLKEGEQVFYIRKDSFLSLYNTPDKIPIKRGKVPDEGSGLARVLREVNLYPPGTEVVKLTVNQKSVFYENIYFAELIAGSTIVKEEIIITV